jgi:hypothetical protein
MIPDPEHIEVLHCALSAILLEHAPEGMAGLGASSSEKIEELLRMVFEKNFSESEFRQALNALFPPGD